MKQWRAAAVAVLLAVLFLIANRGAYQGYFSGDDLDNIRWTSFVPPSSHLKGLLSPRYLPNNYRPVGHGFYHFMGAWFGLEFKPWVAAIHVLHGINCLLLWLLMRKLALGGLHALAGLLFFAFHPAAFDAIWKPMFLFDVFCAMFALLSVLAYLHGRLPASLAFFWLAFKSKELAVMLPAVLLAWEWFLGERRWKRLVPFLALSLWFGLQGLWMNKAAGADYSLSIAPSSLWKTAVFYGSKLLPFTWLGMLLVLMPLMLRSRVVYWGAVGFVLLLAPMLLLPGRLFSAYLYVPFALLAVAVSAALAHARPLVAALCIAAWLPVSYAQLRTYRRAELTLAQENRGYMEALEAGRERLRGVKTFVYDGYPQGLNWWGIQAALRLTLNYDDIEIVPIQDKASRAAFDGPSVAVLSWDPPTRQVSVVARKPGEPDHSYIEMGPSTPIWQLEDGWYPLEHGYRWMKPDARARLRRPPGARRFEIVVNVGPVHIRDVKKLLIDVRLDGEHIGTAEFSQPGWQKRSWDLKTAEAATVTVEFHASPKYLPEQSDPRPLGAAIGGFGFR
jgi:hypothetical protein